MENFPKSLSFSVRKAGGYLGALALATGAFFAGVEIGGESEADSATAFHDMRVLSTEGLMGLVDGGDPAVVALARRLGTREAAFLYVRDRIGYDASRSAGPPGETVAAGAAGCLGKAALLASLYRAQGVADEQVRVVTGQVRYEDGVTDHAWVEIEHEGDCLQQDPSPLLGTFDFDSFPGMAYTRRHVWRELFCFNDEGFAVVSQLNRFKAGGH